MYIGRGGPLWWILTDARGVWVCAGICVWVWGWVSPILRYHPVGVLLWFVVLVLLWGYDLCFLEGKTPETNNVLWGGVGYALCVGCANDEISPIRLYLARWGRPRWLTYGSDVGVGQRGHTWMARVGGTGCIFCLVSWWGSFFVVKVVVHVFDDFAMSRQYHRGFYSARKYVFRVHMHCWWFIVF